MPCRSSQLRVAQGGVAGGCCPTHQQAAPARVCLRLPLAVCVGEDARPRERSRPANDKLTVAPSLSPEGVVTRPPPRLPATPAPTHLSLRLTFSVRTPKAEGEGPA